jgi:hypothetical protein
MMRTGFTVIPALAAAAMSGLSVSPAAAQDKAGDAIAPTTVCLTRQVKGGAEDGLPIVIGLPADKADDFMKRGFKPADCAVTQVIDKDRKQGVCEVAQARDPAVNLYFWQRFGFTPEESCKTISTASAR